MLNLRSFYRSIQDRGVELQSARSSREQHITPGICDYIPQLYFYRQYFSIYIEGLQPQRIIHSILWNQFYQKTLLKEIHAQLNVNNSTKNQQSLISKLDSMMHKVTGNDMIYMKVQGKVYNLKDKLEYGASMELEKEIKQAQSITVEKITQQGKWKKITVDFGPYKNKTEYDIIFSYSPPEKSLAPSVVSSNCQNYTNDKDDNMTTKTTTDQKPTAKQQVRKNSTQSQRKPSKSVITLTQKKMELQKQKQPSLLYETTVKSRSKSKIDNSHISVPASGKKPQSIRQAIKKSEKKIIKESQNQQIIEHQSHKKGIVSCLEVVDNQQQKTLQQINPNLNSTSKLSSSHFSNVIEQRPLQSATIDLRRKQLHQKQKSTFEEGMLFTMETENQKHFSNDQAKSNSVLAQILSKKQETIQTQKRRMEEMEHRHVKQVEELKLNHLKETESFKNEITQILNEYSKKYEAQRDETRKLRQELSSINQVLTSNKVIIAELQIRSKFGEDESARYKQQVEGYKLKVKQMEDRHNGLVAQSRDEQAKLLGERNQAQALADNYRQKYTALARKLKVLMQEEEKVSN